MECGVVRLAFYRCRKSSRNRILYVIFQYYWSHFFIFYTLQHRYNIDPPTQFHKKKKEEKERFWTFTVLCATIFHNVIFIIFFYWRRSARSLFSWINTLVTSQRFFSVFAVKFKGIRHLVMWNVCINILTSTLGLKNITSTRVREHKNVYRNQTHEGNSRQKLW